MTFFVVAPASASRRPAALRKPCGDNQEGSPAAAIACRSHWLKPSTVNGFPYAATRIDTCFRLAAASASSVSVWRYNQGPASFLLIHVDLAFGRHVRPGHTDDVRSALTSAKK